jgi:Tol biopolymer transport system component
MQASAPEETRPQMRRRVRIILPFLALPVFVVALLVVLAFGSVHNDPSGSTDPEWSPDRKQLAYVNYVIPNSGACQSSIWVKNANSGGGKKLAADATHPSWSPDGKRFAVAFINYPSGRGGIAVMSAEGSHLRRLRMRAGIDSTWACQTRTLNDPVWSPNGRLIAFSDAAGKRPGIFVIRPDGSGLRRITTGNDFQPGWSPDGKELVFNHWSTVGVLFDIAVLNVKNGQRKIIVKGIAIGTPSLESDDAKTSPPVWSPTGKQIAFADRFAIQAIPADVKRAVPDVDCTLSQHGCKTVVHCTGSGCSDPSWSRDGGQIAYAAGAPLADQHIKVAKVTMR